MRRLVLIVLAIAIAAGVVFAGFSIVAPYLKPAPVEQPAPVAALKAEAPAPAPERRVVVLTVTKNPGDIIDAARDLTVSSLPAADVPADAFGSMDVLSDAVARNRLDGWEVLLPGKPGTPVTQSMVREVKVAPEPETPAVEPNAADIAFLESLETDPAIVFFSEEQLRSIRLRAAAVVDITIETPLPWFGDGTWVGREVIVSGATLRTTSLDITGHGARPVFYAQLSLEEAQKVRAAQTVGHARLKVEPHRDQRAMPPAGHVCVGKTCFEAIPPEADEGFDRQGFGSDATSAAR